ncbi:hypothetical protein CN495_07330 [Bacillus thuringiensis]|uniref:Uncharacterized protein n=1 Tax=Bacillus thuringiensis TaxID=1428 RepID=A0ABD6SCC2_BACTU|nr:hypothetical protein [Bacillus thuringiensis]PER55557.1 hypothetical protein CN495_07330 [Bacillus thuringiensis]
MTEKQSKLVKEKKKRNIRTRWEGLGKKKQQRAVVGLSVVLAVGISAGMAVGLTHEKKGYSEKDVVKVTTNVKAYDKALDKVKVDAEVKKVADKKVVVDTGTAEGKKEISLSPASAKAITLVSKVPADNAEAMRNTAKELEVLMQEVVPSMQTAEIRDMANKIPEMKKVQLTGMSILQEYLGMANDLRVTADKLEQGTDEEKGRVPGAIEYVKKRADKLKLFEADYAEAKKQAEKIK